MPSETQICNLALIRLGHGQQLTSLDDDTKAARLCNTIFDMVRDTLVESFPWRFAMKRDTLAQSSTTPEFEFDYQYPLPNDCLRAWRMYGAETADFVIEDGNLLTNEDEVELEYVSRVTNAGKFNPSFVDALAYKLALELAEPLANAGENKVARLEKQFEMSINHAYRIGAIEDSPNLDTQDSTWQSEGR